MARPDRPPHRSGARVRLRPPVESGQARQGPYRSPGQRLGGGEHEDRLEDHLPLTDPARTPADRPDFADYTGCAHVVVQSDRSTMKSRHIRRALAPLSRLARQRSHLTAGGRVDQTR